MISWEWADDHLYGPVNQARFVEFRYDGTDVSGKE